MDNNLSTLLQASVVQLGKYERFLEAYFVTEDVLKYVVDYLHGNVEWEEYVVSGLTVPDYYRDAAIDAALDFYFNDLEYCSVPLPESIRDKIIERVDVTDLLAEVKEWHEGNLTYSKDPLRYNGMDKKDFL